MTKLFVLVPQRRPRSQSRDHLLCVGQFPVEATTRTPEDKLEHLCC